MASSLDLLKKSVLNVFEVWRIVFITEVDNISFQRLLQVVSCSYSINLKLRWNEEAGRSSLGIAVDKISNLGDELVSRFSLGDI